MLKIMNEKDKKLQEFLKNTEFNYNKFNSGYLTENSINYIISETKKIYELEDE
jgi:hypothetical protein